MSGERIISGLREAVSHEKARSAVAAVLNAALAQEFNAGLHDDWERRVEPDALLRDVEVAMFGAVKQSRA